MSARPRPRALSRAALWLRRLYGAGPLHLVLGIASLLVSGLAIRRLFDVGAADASKILLWLLGAIVIHDLVALPLYSLAPRLLSRAPASAPGPARFARARAHIRVPTILSGLLLLVFFPLIARASRGDYGDASSLSASPFLDRWLLASAVLYGLSGAVYVARVARARAGGAPGRAVARVSARSLAAWAGLVALGGSGAWLAFASASNDWIIDTSSAGEPHWLRGPLAGALPSLTDASFSALALVMLAGYVVAIACARALPERSALAVAFALVVLFGLAPVLLSSDLFGYVAYARLDVVHHLNPYAHAPIAAPHDPILPLVYWRHATSPYGPLYTLLSLPVGDASLPAATWSLKTLGTVACLVALVLIARAAPAYGRSPGQAVLFVGGNPLLVVWGVGGGHNDLVVLAAACGAILLLARRERAAAGGALLALAAGLKLTGGLLAPFALVASAERRRLLAGAVGAGAATVAITVLVFGTPVLAQVGRIATNGSFVTDYSGPDALGRLLGTGVSSGVRIACAIAAAVVAAVFLWRAYRGADWLTSAALAGLAALLAIPSLVPWYIAWVLPAAALARGRTARAGVIAMTALMMIARLPIFGFQAY